MIQFTGVFCVLHLLRPESHARQDNSKVVCHIQDASHSDLSDKSRHWAENSNLGFEVQGLGGPEPCSHTQAAWCMGHPVLMAGLRPFRECDMMDREQHLAQVRSVVGGVSNLSLTRAGILGTLGFAAIRRLPGGQVIK